MAGVQSLERAFGILRALALGPAGVTDLSERTGLPKSTVSRLLSSLESERAVAQNPDGAYELGDAIAELAEVRRSGQNIVEIARPHMIELMELTGEAVGLNRHEGDGVRTLLQVDNPESAIQVRDWTGETVALHAVPAGLAILAHSSRAMQAKYLEGELETFTPKTMVEPDALYSRFEQIRRRGFSWVHQEFTPDINSVAAVVRDSAGRPGYAIHVHGPAYRFPGSIDQDELGERVAATADRIEAQVLAG